MLKEGAIEMVDQREVVKCTINVMIIGKKSAGHIRINIDATPINVYKYHVPIMAKVQLDQDFSFRFGLVPS